MSAAVYARKSNESELRAGATSESVARQIESATAFATARGWTVDHAAIYYDDAVSGAEFAKLHARRQMVADAEAGKFETLIVSEQSRLGRDMIEVAYTIKQVAESGVKIYGYLDGQELSVEDEVQQAMTMLRGFASASERRQTSKRVRDAAERRVRNGHVGGGRMFGYDNVPVLAPDGTRQHVDRRVDEAEALVVVRIFETYAAGLGSLAIARQLNAERIPAPRPQGWSQATVRDILGNPLYRGEMVWGKRRKVVRRGKIRHVGQPAATWTRVPMPALRIVADDLWHAAQARRAQRRRAIPRSATTGRILGRPSWFDGHSNYLWTGFGRCEICQGNIRINHQKHGRAGGRQEVVRTYACGTNQQRGREMCANDILIRQEALDRALIEALAELVSPSMVDAAVERAVSRLQAGQQEQNAQRVALERQLAAVESQERRLVAAITSGGDLEPLVAALRAEGERKAALQEALAALTDTSRGASLDAHTIKQALLARVADVRGLLTTSDSVPAVRTCVRKLLVGPIHVTPIHEGGRRGLTFSGTLTFQWLLTGTVLSSLTGGTTGSTIASRRIPTATPSFISPSPRQWAPMS
jgi:DNA invertase Pin-like site-specific DNA recombinase